MTYENFAKFEKKVGKKYSKSINPYNFYVKQLKELDRASKVANFDYYMDPVNS